MPEPAALYVPNGDTFIPTELTRGPWSPDAQHGGPPAGLLARAVETHEGADFARVTRLTIELLRPVPLTPLRVETRTVRPGKKVQLVGASIYAGDVEVSRAKALRIRTTPLTLPDGLRAPTPPPGVPANPGPPMRFAAADWVAFHSHGVEMRFVKGNFTEPGPSTVWMRLRQPLVAGEETTPLQRVACVADFGNGVSGEVDFDTWLFINPDLSIHLQRHPVGEWVCLDASTALDRDGIGLAHSRLWDESGPLGHALQSLLVDDHR